MKNLGESAKVNGSIALWVLLFLILMFDQKILYAQGCCSSGAPFLGALELPTASKGQVQLSLAYRNNALKDVYFEKDRVDDGSRQRFTQTVTLETNVGILNWFTLDLLFTWIQQERQIHAIGVETVNRVQLAGLGDFIIMPKIAIISPNVIQPRELSIGVGMKLPTGKNDLRSQGLLASDDLQPGTGATDIIFWGFFYQGFQQQRFQLFTNISLRMTGTNNRGYQFGNEMIGSVGFGYQLTHKWNLRNQMRIRYAGADRFQAFNIPNTGGDWLYWIPGLSYELYRGLIAQASVEIPVYRKVQGIQLTTTRVVNVSFVYQFQIGSL